MPPPPRGSHLPRAGSDPRPDAIPLGPWLEHLEQHLPIAALGQDPEGAHQVRVAAARLDVWLRLDRRRILRDDLRWLRRAAGVVRDIDVVLARGVDVETEALLVKQHASAQRLLAHLLARPRARALRESLALLPPLDRGQAQEGLEEWSKSAQRFGRRTKFGKDELARLHRLRRGLRRLRYAREWLGLGTRALQRLLEALGDLNDLAVMCDRMRAAKAGECSPWEGDLDSLERQNVELRRRAAERWRDASKEIEQR